MATHPPYQHRELHIEWMDSGPAPGRKVITTSGVDIGRHPTSGVYLPQPMVSWQHARVWRSDDRCYIKDLNSKNGTFLNGQRLPPDQRSILRVGDVLRIGPCELKITTSATSPGPPVDLRWSELNVGTRILIGRDPSCDVVLAYPNVSRRHAMVTRTVSGWSIEDLSSTNGTFVNRRRVTTSSVIPGDRIRIGLTEFTLTDGEVGWRDDVGQIRVDAMGLSRTLRKSGSTLTLLNDVSLTILPREFVAIAGASGAGKTTLLTALNGYRPATSGRVLLSGIDYYSHPDLFRNAIGYVPQDDIVHQDLRVESALRYAARLRLPSDTSEAEVMTLVARVSMELGIEDRRDSFVRSLSGGERKRVNIGVELLTHPSLLFLDEPTSGLDPGIERRIIQQLRSLANEGRTIVVVTHSIHTIDAYDKVAFMSRGGYLAFFGRPKEALEFFRVSEFAAVYDLLDDRGYGEGYWSNRFRDHSARSHGGLSSVPIYENHEPAANTPQRTSAVRQFQTLLLRYLEVIRGDTRNLGFWLAQAPLISIIIAVLFNSNTFASEQMPDSSNNLPIQDAPLVLFLLAFSAVCFGLCNSAREIVKEKAIYQRERHVSLRVGPYLASKVVVLGVVGLMQCVILLGVVRLKMDFGVNGHEFLGMLFLLFLGATSAAVLGLWLSACATSTDQAVTLVTALLLVQVIFSGLIRLEKLSDSVRWLTSLCITRWSYGGLCGITHIADRWRDAGIGNLVHQVLETSATRSVYILGIMSVVSVVVVSAVMVAKDKRRD